MSLHRRCETHFDISNRLACTTSVTDRQTKRETDRKAFSNSAVCRRALIMMLMSTKACPLATYSLMRRIHGVKRTKWVIRSVSLGIRTKYKWKYSLQLSYILVIRTKYELHSFVVGLLISSNYLDRRKKLSSINDSLFADCALNKLVFPV